MRVLMISDVYFPRINGVSTSIQTFSRELQQLGHTVDLIAPAYPGQPPDAGAIERIGSHYLFFDPEDRMMRGSEIRRLLPKLRRCGYDLVHIQTPFVAHYAGLRLAAELNVPVLESYHTYFEEYLFHYLPWLPRGPLRAAARSFSRRQCNAVDAVVVPSGPMQGVLRNYGVTAPLHVIPTGLQMHRFAAGDGGRFRRQFGIGQERPLLLHAGRLAHEKNIDFLLRVLQRVAASRSDVLLVIAGDGPARAHLERLSAQLGLQGNTLFVGYLEREGALVDGYRAADAFVFASRTETQGLVLLEAMAAGTPVVSTAHLGTCDILGPGCGALVAVDDVDDFAGKVIRLLDDADLRARLGAEAHDYAQSWSAAALAGKLEQLYLSLLTPDAVPPLATEPAAVR
ncbi:MAG: glycosyltransferase [Xanthomonadaceae bacterium]|jgi:glycosyltransferase involved in cell wall biosynthesis|nr:glycosyltransferase [Xanthomonadaceae bacterium]